MSKRVVLAVIGVVFLVVIGCSDKQDEIKPKDSLDNNKTKIDSNETKKDSNLSKVKINDTKKAMMVIQEEFVPEHIKRSHIEVVPH